MAEKVNKDERKNMGEIFVFNETQETPDFWRSLGIESGEQPEAPLQVGYVSLLSTLFVNRGC